jgi:transcriptional regulator with XRE-family HTH domain
MTLKDFISGETVEDTSEERNVQLLAHWLVSLGYRFEQIQTHPQYTLASCFASTVDLAVFQDERRTDDTLILIGECKKSDHPTFEPGLDQLWRYMRLTKAVAGIHFDGEDLNYLLRFQNVGVHLEALRGLANPTPPHSSFYVYLRERRQARAKDWHTKRHWSVRQVAQRVGIEPSYLSKIERGKVPPPSEAIIEALAKELGEDPSELLVRAGRFPQGMEAAAVLRPRVLAELFDQIQDLPEEALRKISKISRQVRDGDW